MAKKKTETNEATEVKIKRPAVWAQAKSINVTEGIMYQCKFDDKTNYKNIEIVHSSGVGVKSHDGLPEKEMADANPYRGDICYMASDCDTIQMVFGIKFLPIINNINSCSDYNYKKELIDFINSNTMHLEKLAKRYLFNIYAGNFWWRNKFGAKQIETHIISTDIRENIDSINFAKTNEIVTCEINEELVKNIVAALSGEQDYYEIQVISYLQAGFGAEVYPSQEMPDDAMKEKAKVLFTRGGTAAMHSQKIGNAIRTIDTWYKEYDEYEMVIAAEPYGTAKNVGKAFRTSSQSFYKLIDKAMDKNNIKGIGEQIYYVLACLIRGGVFGLKMEKKKEVA